MKYYWAIAIKLIHNIKTSSDTQLYTAMHAIELHNTTTLQKYSTLHLYANQHHVTPRCAVQQNKLSTGFANIDSSNTYIASSILVNDIYFCISFYKTLINI